MGSTESKPPEAISKENESSSSSSSSSSFQVETEDSSISTAEPAGNRNSSGCPMHRKDGSYSWDPSAAWRAGFHHHGPVSSSNKPLDSNNNTTAPDVVVHQPPQHVLSMKDLLQQECHAAEAAVLKMCHNEHESSPNCQQASLDFVLCLGKRLCHTEYSALVQLQQQSAVASNAASAASSTTVMKDNIMEADTALEILHACVLDHRNRSQP
jgi:hypothetical protein